MTSTKKIELNGAEPPTLSEAAESVATGPVRIGERLNRSERLGRGGAPENRSVASTEKIEVRGAEPPRPSDAPKIAQPAESAETRAEPPTPSDAPKIAQPAESAQTGPLRIGQRFVNWQIRGLLGRGGYGFVYDAHNVLRDKSVALKIIAHPSNLKRAKSEADVGDKLPDCENIVKLEQSGVTEQGLVYLEMQKVLGPTVHQAIIDYGCLTPFEMLVTAWQICLGVAAAHGVNVLHRDLKLENVFFECGNICLGVVAEHEIGVVHNDLDRENVVYERGNKVLVGDFGIAKDMGEAPLTTQKDVVHCSVSTVAPERLLGIDASFSSDVFSIGCMMFEMSHGVAPALLGLEEVTFEAIGFAQINKEPPRLDKLHAGFPSFAARVIHRALAKKPSERFQTVEELGDLCLKCALRIVHDARLRGVKLGQGELAMRPLYMARAELEKEWQAKSNLKAKPAPPSVVADTVRYDGGARVGAARPSEQPLAEQTLPLFREAKAVAAAPAPLAAVQESRQPRPRLRPRDGSPRPDVAPTQFISGVVATQVARSPAIQARPPTSAPAPGNAPPGRAVPPVASPAPRRTIGVAPLPAVLIVLGPALLALFLLFFWPVRPAPAPPVATTMQLVPNPAEPVAQPSVAPSAASVPSVASAPVPSPPDAPAARALQPPISSAAPAPNTAAARGLPASPRLFSRVPVRPAKPDHLPDSDQLWLDSDPPTPGTSKPAPATSSRPAKRAIF